MDRLHNYVESVILNPIIQTIDADGTSRYFDLQGRMLNGKPDKGLYIKNGRKFVNP